jgi:hypothetical protein
VEIALQNGAKPDNGATNIDAVPLIEVVSPGTETKNIRVDAHNAQRARRELVATPIFGNLVHEFERRLQEENPRHVMEAVITYDGSPFYPIINIMVSWRRPETPDA